VTNVAVVDCGTNSTRLLVADRHGTTLRREMRITRLGQGVDATGTLAPEALERNYECLRDYAAIMRDNDVTHARLVATSAARDASNGPEFLERAAAITGARVALISGDEEAELSYRGATSDLPESDDVTMIVDIGGGSTELAARLDGRLAAHSMQVGCVRVTERALGSGVVTPTSEALAREMVDDALDDALRRAPELGTLIGRVRLVGLAGTVSTLAALDAGLEHYDRDAVHHRELTRSTVGEWRRILGEEPPSARLERAGMVKGREDVLVAGLIVLEEVMDRFAIDALITSESDILDGLVAALNDELDAA
jgi:exopolyphosphatase/guanosine-5'-triphosphate,3'-diphosphate pyrophosphatase